MSALLMPNDILSMTAQAARRVVELGDGDCALLYLALLERGGDGEAAARRLNWPAQRLDAAWSRLAARELVAPAAPQTPAPTLRDDRPPEYNRSDVIDALEREPEFTGLYREMERLLCRTMSEADMKSLYTIYDYLALPPEVILLLTHYVIHTLRRKKGPGSESFPRMSSIRKEAFVWKRLGIDTVELAEEHIRRQELTDSREWAILSAVGVKEPRPAIDREREYIDKWVSMGLSDELIGMAYERTVFRKGAMNWPYMHRILQNWHEAGWKTPEQVRAEDRPNPKPRQSGKKKEDYQPSRERIRKNSDWLDDFLREQEKGG